MRITAVNAVHCRAELARPIPLACGVLTHRNFGLIRIETDAGVTGWGETSVNFPPWVYRERIATIDEGLAPLLVGENALDTLRLRDRMVTATRSFTRMWAEGALAQAISGVEMALWDLKGKALDQPVARLLGGIQRDTFRCYATGLKTDDPAAGAREAVTAGYGAIKIRIGFDEDTDISMARSVREAIGPDIALLIDANQAYDRRRAKRMIGALRDLDPYWIEEPVLADDFAGMRDLRRQFPEVPMAWGENIYRLDHFQRAARSNLVDIMMPDPCRCGGLAAAIDAARLANSIGIPVSAHHYGSDLGCAAMLHFMAAIQSTDLVLRDIADAPLREEIIIEDLRPGDGIVHLPDGSGLGVTPDLDVIANTRHQS